MGVQWPVILFTFFSCLAAGIFCMLGVLNLAGRGKKMQVFSLVSALIFAIVAAVCVLGRLQHVERIFNGFGNLTSGVTVELIAIIVFVVVLVLYFLMMRRDESGVAPKWCAVVAVVVSLALPIAACRSYQMAAVPAWETPLLPAYYLVNMLLLGGLASMIIASAVKEDDSAVVKCCSIVSLAGAVCCAVVTLIYAATMAGTVSTQSTYSMNSAYYGTPTSTATTALGTTIMAGEHGVLFWVGTIVAGCIVPLVVGACCLLGKLKSRGAVFGGAAIALICAIVGSFVWRCLIYTVAQGVTTYF